MQFTPDPEGFYNLTKFEPHSRSCTIMLKLSAKELDRLPSFVGAVHASQHTAASEKMLKGHKRN
jgi:hypothetical protein